ncbi:MAG: TonB-dependent receptor plug domain-containing protein [Novosphingobium sp.]
MTSTDGTEKGDPSAAFMQDGIYIARPQVQEVSFFDIGRIEVLRGPQGTLYGRNTTAGVVNLISAKPKLGKFEGSVDLTYGNYNTFQA